MFALKTKRLQGVPESIKLHAFYLINRPSVYIIYRKLMALFIDIFDGILLKATRVYSF